MSFSKLLDNFKDDMFDEMFNALIGKITKIHDDKKVDVKPLYKFNGDKKLSIIPQVPLMFLGNGKSIIQIESEVGDYVIVIVSDYDIDNLILSGEEKIVNTNSKHQINDALALPFSFTPFNSIKNQDNSILIKKNGDIEIKNSGNIYLGEDSTEGVPLGDTLKTWLDNHTHNYTWTNVGGSGTTNSPGNASPQPSQKVKVK